MIKLSLEYIILFGRYPPIVGSGFPLQSFCKGTQKGFSLQSLTQLYLKQKINLHQPNNKGRLKELGNQFYNIMCGNRLRYAEIKKTNVI